MLGGPPMFAVALRAHVKRGFGIVVAGQVSRRIGTPRAEFDSHVPPPGFFAVIGLVCRRGTHVIPIVGIIAVVLNRFGRDRGHSATCNRLFQYSETMMMEIDGSIVRR